MYKEDENRNIFCVLRTQENKKRNLLNVRALFFSIKTPYSLELYVALWPNYAPTIIF